MDGFLTQMVAGAIALAATATVSIVTYVKRDKEGREITEADGVFKSKGKFYAYCPTCGRKCGHPQIIRGTGQINTCIFECYKCSKKFKKQYDYTILKG